MAYYDIEAGPLGEAVKRAVGLAVRQPPAHDEIFGMDRLIQVDWEHAAHCHHTNMPLVAAIGGMIDPTAAEAALGPKYRLVSACGRVSALDDIQDGILLAAAGEPPGNGHNPRRFTQAVLGLIEAEGLEGYFEIEDRAYAGDHHGIRPYGYAKAIRMDSGPGDIERTKVAARTFEQDRRIPLVLILSLYNEYMAKDVLKGRGWVFHGARLGRWLRGRFRTNPQSARHALTALGSYPGW